MASQMRAIVHREYGPPDVLKLQDVEKPTPQDGEVLIKVHASSVNFPDWTFLRGRPFFIRLMSGLLKPKNTILGADIAGQVEAVGGNTRRLRPGDRVFGDMSDCGFGRFAEYVSAPEQSLVEMPDSITFEEAAASPMAAVVALQDSVMKDGYSRGIRYLSMARLGASARLRCRSPSRLGLR